MTDIAFLLPILFLVYSLFCSFAFGRSLQIRTNYNLKSFASTLLLGMPMYLLAFMLAMIPTILINFTAKELSYYLYTVIGVLLIIAIVLVVYNRRLIHFKISELLAILGTTFFVGIIFIFVNDSVSLSESNKVLNNITSNSFFSDNFIINNYSFCWVRYLSGWVSLFQTKDIIFANYLIQYGVFLFFSFFLTSVLFSIGKDLLKWRDNINIVLMSTLSLLCAFVFSLTKLDIVGGFLIPLFVLLTIIVLFAYSQRNVTKTKGISLLIGVLFNLLFLLDYNTWAISFTLMLSLLIFQGYRWRAIDLRDFIIWFCANMLNIIIIYSQVNVVPIVLLILTGLISLIVIRYLSGNTYSKRFKLERRIWKYGIALLLLLFSSFSIASLLFSQLTTDNSIFQWLDEGFWGENLFSSLLAKKIFLAGDGLLIILFGSFGFYKVWFSSSKRVNLMTIISYIYLVFFFNPLLTPLFNFLHTTTMYYSSFIFLCAIVFLFILEMFKGIFSFKSSEFLIVFPILVAALVACFGYFVYKQFIIVKKLIVDCLRCKEQIYPININKNIEFKNHAIWKQM